MRCSKPLVVLLASTMLLTACSGGFFGNGRFDESRTQKQSGREANSGVTSGSSLRDLFSRKGSSVKVNRFLWTASLEVLDFLPIQTADPFTGVISTGYGRPPNGGTAYRATVLISDPALDARSLNVAVQTQRGPVSVATQRAIEDAILTRARQLRVAAGRY